MVRKKRVPQKRGRVRRVRPFGAPGARRGALVARAAGLCLARAVLLPVLPAAGAEEVRLTTELVDLRELRTRLDVEVERLPALGAARLLWIDVRGQGGVSARAFGLCAQGLLVGPVRPTGLLRELADPLGFGPGSDVFGEPSGLRLDTAFSPERRGVAIGGPPGGCTLYLMRAGPVLCSGFLLDRPGLQGAGAELLLGASEPSAGPPEDRWYLAEPGHPGGLLCHAAARLARRGAGVRGAAAAGLSVGERVPPEGFLRCSLRAEQGRWQGDLLAVAASAGYVSPEGRLGDWSRAVGMRLRFGPGEPFSASGEYRLQTAPARGWPEGWREAREQIGVDLRAGGGFGRPGALHGALSCDLCRRFEADGSVDREAAVRLEADADMHLGVAGAWARCTLWTGLGEDSGEWTAAGGVRWELEARTGQKGWLEAKISGPRGIEITVAVESRARRGDFRCRLALSPWGVESSLGWEVER